MTKIGRLDKKRHPQLFPITDKTRLHYAAVYCRPVLSCTYPCATYTIRTTNVGAVDLPPLAYHRSNLQAQEVKCLGTVGKQSLICPNEIFGRTNALGQNNGQHHAQQLQFRAKDGTSFETDIPEFTQHVSPLRQALIFRRSVPGSITYPVL